MLAAATLLLLLLVLVVVLSSCAASSPRRRAEQYPTLTREGGLSEHCLHKQHIRCVNRQSTVTAGQICKRASGNGSHPRHIADCTIGQVAARLCAVVLSQRQADMMKSKTYLIIVPVFAC